MCPFLRKMDNMDHMDTIEQNWVKLGRLDKSGHGQGKNSLRPVRVAENDYLFMQEAAEDTANVLIGQKNKEDD